MHEFGGMKMNLNKLKNGNLAIKMGSIPMSLKISHSNKILPRKTNKFKCKEFSMDYIYYASQDKVAENETASDAYGLLNTALNFQSNSKNLDISLGVKNVLNQTYIPHLSRLKTYEIPNIGRSYYIKLCLTL